MESIAALKSIYGSVPREAATWLRGHLTQRFDSHASALSWTIAFDGKNIGQVKSRALSKFEFYSTIGQEPLTGDAAAPTVGEPSEEFAGFEFEPVYRPLIAVSVPNYRDPENWKPTGISASTIAALHKAFRGRFPRVLNCANDEERPKLWAYPDANVVVKKSYGSSRGWLIAQLSLIGYKCDGPPDEAFAYQAFAVTPQQQIRFLDSGMSLVDAGDYDNDGRSELIFAKGGYNRDGYKLFYDDFRRGATFQFGYH